MDDGCWVTDDRCWMNIKKITMSEKFKFEKLRIWSKAMDLGEDINTLTVTQNKTTNK